MNILHVTKFLPPYKGGIEFVTEKLATAGISSGANVRIAGVKTDDVPSKQSNNWGAIELRSIGRIGPVEIAPGYFHLDNHFQWADVVHLHLPNPIAEIATLIDYKQHFKDSNKRLVPVFHAPITNYPLVTYFLEKFVQTKILDFSETILLVSPKLLNIRRSTRRYIEKTSVIPFPTEKPYAVPKLHNDESVNILAIGRLVEYKGFLDLINALSKVPSKNWRLNIIGTGPLLNKINRLISHFGLSEKINLLGHVTDNQKHQQLADCDLFTMPSTTTQEGYGIVLAEAFSYGKAAVVSNIDSGVNFLNRLGQCGALCEPNDPDSLAAALDKMIRDKTARDKSAEINKIFWDEYLTIEKFNQNYQKIIFKDERQKNSIPA